MKLIPKNWSLFQHYKDRCPPWIKLHRDLLNNRDFICLPTASKALAPMMWLLASESKNGIFDASIAELEFRLRMPASEIKIGIKSLIEKGFFIDADTLLAPCLHDATPETEREAETETKKETKTEKKERATRLQDNWQPSDAMIQFCKTERPDLQWQFIADGFRDYWIAQAGAKGRKVDWEATWRNWIRNQRRQPGTYENAKEKSRRETYEVLTGKRKADDAIIDLN
jgi:hypothetical protein